MSSALDLELPGGIIGYISLEEVEHVAGKRDVWNTPFSLQPLFLHPGKTKDDRLMGPKSYSIAISAFNK